MGSQGLFSLTPPFGHSGAALQRRPEDPESALQALLIRMRQRQYPETIPVLASYWLKTVYASGKKRSWWNGLYHSIEKTLKSSEAGELARQALTDIQTWIQQEILATGKTPTVFHPTGERFRASLSPERLPFYLKRLLNQWLPSEVAWLLVNESEPAFQQDGGIPVLAVGRALERLLVREGLSPESLELLLHFDGLTARDVYPEHLEILRDVLLARLGRVWAPPAPAMPAEILANGSLIPQDFREAVRNAVLIANGETEELHVPIAAAQAMEILKSERVHIGSILVTMDGRCWESENLQSEDQYSVVYKPAGQLRIDDAKDHGKLEIPWPDARLQWAGGVHFSEPFQIFGREWTASSWETDGERSWLHLVFSRFLPIPDSQPASEKRFRRSRPAVVDMAWGALENALASAMAEKSREPIEQLRRPEMIPIGRAIYGLGEAVMNWLPKREAIETQLRAIRYLESAGSPLYGRVPWRILPAHVQKAFLKKRPDAAMLELLNEVFDELPAPLGTSSPSQAA